MKRLLTLLAVAGLTAAVACGDDSGDNKTTTPTPDAGGIDSGATPVADTGTGVVARPTQVENPGAACTTATSKTDCKGPSATCNESIMVGQNNIKLQGGYCSAQCNASSECGTGGCPAAEVTASLPAAIVDLAGPLLTGLIPSSCLDKCDKNGPDVCRSGYECRTIAELVPADFGPLAATFTSGPAFKVAYCLPPINLAPSDAGRPAAPVDAGIRSGLDGGADSGL